MNPVTLIRSAPRTERRLAVVTVVCCLALLAWALVPDRATSNATQLSAGANRRANGASAQIAANDSTADASNGTPSDGAAVGADSAGGQSSTGGAAGGPAGPLTATDVGVSSDTITIGVGLVDLAGLSQAGFGVGLRGDEDKVAAALVDDISQRGINGRKLTAHIYKIDPLDNSKARAGCLQATEQDQVFAYVDTLSQYTAAQESCVAVEHHTPLVTPTPLNAEYQTNAGGYQLSPIQNDNRAIQDAVLRANAAGFFDAANGFKKLGILDDGCEPSVNADARAALAQIGINSDRISEFTLDCDGNNAVGQVPSAVLKHKNDGVTHVFTITQYVSIQTYVTDAKAQLFKPRYLVSDFGGMTADVSVENYDPDQWDGTMGITSSHTGETAAGLSLPPLLQECNQVLVAHGLPAMKNVSGSDGEAAYLCENLHLFEQLAALAGPNLTRAAFVQALPQVGVFRGAFTDTAVFDRPGKYSGGDTVAVEIWHKDCTCYVQTQGFQPAPS
jgi:hypothetical protein